MTSVYEETYARSLGGPAGLWGAAAEDLYWDRRWARVFDDSRPPYSRWFTGGMLNTCYNALDLHVDRGRGKQRALVYDSPVTDTIRVFTYAELRIVSVTGDRKSTRLKLQSQSNLVCRLLLEKKKKKKENDKKE